jgi:hypothetical protein
MSSGNSFGEKQSGMEVMATNLEPHLEEMPHLKGLHSEIVVHITEAKSLRSEQEVARAQFRDLTQRRKTLIKQGDSLRSRVAAALRSSFGFQSEQLLQFGVSPRPRVLRPRKAKTAPVPGAGQPAATSGDKPGAQ